jgi:prepilin-type N-terminal cleavage/methylation domain-containing protein
MNQSTKLVQKNKRGFTLMELIVAIAVSAIFFAIASTIIVSLYRCYHNAIDVNDHQMEISQINLLMDNTIKEFNKEGDRINLSISSDELTQTISVEKDNIFIPFITISKNDDGTYLFSYSSPSGATYTTSYINSFSLEKTNSGLLQVEFCHVENETQKNLNSKKYQVIGGIV